MFPLMRSRCCCRLYLFRDDFLCQGQFSGPWPLLCQPLDLALGCLHRGTISWRSFLFKQACGASTPRTPWMAMTKWNQLPVWQTWRGWLHGWQPMPPSRTTWPVPTLGKMCVAYHQHGICQTPLPRVAVTEAPFMGRPGSFAFQSPLNLWSDFFCKLNIFQVIWFARVAMPIWRALQVIRHHSSNWRRVGTSRFSRNEEFRIYTSWN